MSNEKINNPTEKDKIDLFKNLLNRNANRNGHKFFSLYIATGEITQIDLPNENLDYVELTNGNYLHTFSLNRKNAIKHFTKQINYINSINDIEENVIEPI